MRITAHCDPSADRLSFCFAGRKTWSVVYLCSVCACAYACLSIFQAGPSDEWDAKDHLLHFKRPSREHLVPLSGGQVWRIRPFKLLDDESKQAQQSMMNEWARAPCNFGRTRGNICCRLITCSRGSLRKMTWRTWVGLNKPLWSRCCKMPSGEKWIFCTKRKLKQSELGISFPTNE